SIPRKTVRPGAKKPPGPPAVFGLRWQLRTSRLAIALSRVYAGDFRLRLGHVDRHFGRLGHLAVAGEIGYLNGDAEAERGSRAEFPDVAAGVVDAGRDRFPVVLGAFRVEQIHAALAEIGV